MNFYQLTEYQKIKTKFWNGFLSDLNSDYFEALIESDDWVYLDHTDAISFYWFQQYKNFFEILEVTDETSDEKSKNLSENEEILFDVWQSGPFAKDFLKFSNRSSVKEASYKCLELFERQLVAFFRLHIAQDLKTVPETYRADFEIGDVVNGKETKINHNPIKLEFNFNLLNNDAKKEAQHIKRLNTALKKLSEYVPASFERLKLFTSHIIPINDRGIVSYSSQELPGYSVINLYHRDDMDLLDDLLHENGHHHLNYYLNTQELIIEEEEQAYYSPWRKSMRPVRGIYHAFFTFYWALDLFQQLSQPKLLEKFSKPEQDKILLRFCEEHHMLYYCIPDLVLMKAEGLILPTGYQLIEHMMDNLKKQQVSITQFEKKLSPKALAKINDLKKVLKNQHEIRSSIVN
ncbi:MAG: hypothetical protein JNM93_03415 [Bacteriovoracaceae bacterium]|nr:hypothetical protein [Bacteriovoracaceae bacterium]